mmetsp:Transcript_60364/g.139175  ORF Transcript_60364/g.139175 Transcript_60364/m.139175 type:complete len:454 (-) Transcript_60364:154-1515(-)
MVRHDLHLIVSVLLGVCNIQTSNLTTSHSCGALQQVAESLPTLQAYWGRRPVRMGILIEMLHKYPPINSPIRWVLPGRKLRRPQKVNSLVRNVVDGRAHSPGELIPGNQVVPRRVHRVKLPAQLSISTGNLVHEGLGDVPDVPGRGVGVGVVGINPDGIDEVGELLEIQASLGVPVRGGNQLLSLLASDFHPHIRHHPLYVLHRHEPRGVHRVTAKNLQQPRPTPVPLADDLPQTLHPVHSIPMFLRHLPSLLGVQGKIRQVCRSHLELIGRVLVYLVNRLAAGVVLVCDAGVFPVVVQFRGLVFSLHPRPGRPHQPVRPLMPRRLHCLPCVPGLGHRPVLLGLVERGLVLLGRPPPPLRVPPGWRLVVLALGERAHFVVGGDGGGGVWRSLRLEELLSANAMPIGPRRVLRAVPRPPEGLPRDGGLEILVGLSRSGHGHGMIHVVIELPRLG